MGTLIRTLCLLVALCTSALAVDRSARDWRTEKQKGRTKDCIAKAGNKVGDERKSFMSKCLRAEDINKKSVP